MVIFWETSYKKTKRRDEIYIKLSIEKQDFKIIISKVHMKKVNAGNSSLNSTFDTNLNDIKRFKLKILITRDILKGYLQFFSAQNSSKYVKIISLFQFLNFFI